jgi:phosphinothricin acetyltransferase
MNPDERGGVESVVSHSPVEAGPPTAAIEVRAAVPADGPACADIYRSYCARVDVNLELDPPSGEQMSARIEAALATHAWVVAELDGSVVAYASASPFLDRPAFRWAALVSVYVDQSHLGRGIGRSLYAELFPRLARRGFQIALATVVPTNRRSLALHHSLGFDRVGTWSKVAWKRGAWHDLACLQLRLDLPAG